jgi:hypothetical protein
MRAAAALFITGSIAMDHTSCSQRRRGLLLALPALLSLASPTRAQNRASLRRLGIFSLLGDSVRVVGRETREALFKDVAMDKVALDSVGAAVLARHAQTELRHFRAPSEVDVQDQVNQGLAAGRRGELPSWVAQAAREADLSHALLVSSNVGAREFKTAMSEVESTRLVTGVGFVVSGDLRFKDPSTGHVANGYLAPFVQLRLTLLDMAGPRVVHSAAVGEGFVVGPPFNEAPDPWQFLTRAQKASALDGLMRKVIGRGMQEVLAAV